MTHALVLPTFIGCGAPKAGSTTLWKLLSLHPEIGMSKRKEVYFFTRQGEKVFGYPMEHGYYDRGLQWYSQHFAPFAEKKARGEFSPWYFASPAVRRRIQKDLPHVKLIFVLRDPVDRMYSHFREQLFYYDFNNPEKVGDFSKVEKSKYFHTYVCISSYHRHLAPWYEEFAEKQLKVVLFDDLRRDQLAVLNEIAQFLGVSLVEQIPQGLVHEAQGKVFKYPFFHNLRWMYRKIVPNWLKDVLQLSNRLRKVLYSHKVPPVPRELRQKLIEKYFYRDIEELQRLIGRDLSEWLKVDR